jgi:hypothetical protein
MTPLMTLLLGGAAFSLHWQPGIGAQYREPADQSFERPIYAFNDENGKCSFRMREWATFEDWQRPSFKPRWVKMVAWTRCERLLFKDVEKGDFVGMRLTPESDATFNDVQAGAKLVSVSGDGTEVVVFFDGLGRQREIWISD